MVRYVYLQNPTWKSEREANCGRTTQAPEINTSVKMLNFAGPVGQNVQAEAAKTRDEFADLANSRQTPDYKAATGQNLTRMFFSAIFHVSCS